MAAREHGRGHDDVIAEEKVLVGGREHPPAGGGKRECAGASALQRGTRRQLGECALDLRPA